MSGLLQKRGGVWVDIGSGGSKIDSSSRAANFDVQAVGNTWTDVDGLRVIVPPQLRPFQLRTIMPVNFVTGTAAIAAMHQVQVQILDEGLGLLVGYNVSTYTQVTAVSKGVTQSLAIESEMPPNAVSKVYKVQTRLALPTGGSSPAANWTSTTLLAGDLPTSGTFPPIWLSAVSV